MGVVRIRVSLDGLLLEGVVLDDLGRGLPVVWSQEMEILFTGSVEGFLGVCIDDGTTSTPSVGLEGDRGLRETNDLKRS